MSNQPTAPAMPPLSQPHRVRRVHVADEVFDSLACSIVGGEVEPGSTLPPERDLADRYDVSRLIVRQAIHRLADLGLVRVRQGGATVVNDPALADDPRVSVLALRFSPERESQLAALRERQVVGSLSMLVLAGRRCQPKDIVRLESIVTEAERYPERLAELNEAFWISIADATANPFFQRETRYWFRVIRHNRTLGKRATLPPEQRVAAYKLVIEALKQGRSAAKAYLSSIEILLDYIDQTDNPDLDPKPQ